MGYVTVPLVGINLDNYKMFLFSCISALPEFEELFEIAPYNTDRRGLGKGALEQAWWHPQISSNSSPNAVLEKNTSHHWPSFLFLFFFDLYLLFKIRENLRHSWTKLYSPYSPTTHFEIQFQKPCLFFFCNIKIFGLTDSASAAAPHPAIEFRYYYQPFQCLLGHLSLTCNRTIWT